MSWLLVLILIWSSHADAATLTGHPLILDANTMLLSGERIRLKGIDAPDAHTSLPGRGRARVRLRPGRDACAHGQKLAPQRSGARAMTVTSITRYSPRVTSMTWISTAGSFNKATRWRTGKIHSNTSMRKKKQKA